VPESPQSRIVVRDERLQRLVIPVEPGLEIPAFLARPEGEAKGLAITVDDRGKEAIAAEPSFNRLLGEGWAVCGLDPRGIGELATTQMGWVSAVSLLLGENFVSRQGCDMRRSARALAASEPFEGKPLGLYARGPNAALAATYLLAQEARGRRLPVRWYVLRDGFVSYQQFLDRPQSIEQSFRLQSSSKERFTPYDREIPFHFFPFRVLSHFDLPQLLGESSARGLIVNPIDGDWLPMSEPDARKLAPANVKVVVDGDPESSILELIRMPSASSAPPR
jgi:hypothetical protein